MLSESAMFGKYQIDREIAQGGMGIVYLGHHVETGKQVAIKTVRLIKAEFLSSIRREIKTLASIKHPQIVAIVDDGIRDGLPWYAMDWLEGLTLRLHCLRIWKQLESNHEDSEADTTQVKTALETISLKNIGQKSTPQMKIHELQEAGIYEAAAGCLDEALSFIHSICEPLAFLHGEGIAHLDLKPDNITIQANQQAVLMDFGVSERHRGDLHRESLDSSFPMGGTLTYMAPEQIQNLDTDARTDLYSLGCILYELITGQPPFFSHQPYLIMNGHLLEQPVPPSKRVKGVPEKLDKLILNLLEKNPRDRLGHAHTVSKVLEELGVPEKISTPATRSYLYRSELIGRKSELDLISQHFDNLVSQKGCFIIISGESGIGKTRLLLSSVRIAKEKRLLVSANECELNKHSAISGTGSLQSINQWIRDLIDFSKEMGTSTTHEIWYQQAHVLVEYFPELAALFPDKTLQKPAELSPDASRERLMVYLAEIVQNIARYSPLVLVIDDLHAADPMTIEFLNFTLHTKWFQRNPVLILTTARHEAMSKSLMKLTAHPDTVSMNLKPLEQPHVKEIINQMLAIGSPPQTFVNYLSDHAAGNPFFVAEYLRSALEQELLFRDSRGQWHVIDRDAYEDEPQKEVILTPETVRQLIQNRFKLLPNNAKHIAKSMAIAGFSVDIDFIIQISDETLSMVLESISTMMIRDMILEQPPGFYRFRNEAIRDAIYSSISLETRQILHRKIAQTLDRMIESKHRHYPENSGYHWEKAGDFEKAIISYRKSGLIALNRSDTETAENLLNSFFRLADTNTLMYIETRLHYLKNIEFNRGSFQKIIAELNEMLRNPIVTADNELFFMCRLYVSEAHWKAGKQMEALEIGHSILNQLQFEEYPELYIQSLLNQATIHHYLGNTENAIEIERRAAKRAEEINLKAQLCFITANMGHSYWTMGQLEEAETCYKQSIKEMEKLNLQKELGDVYGNLAGLYHATGKLKNAQHLYEKALDISRQIGDRRSEGIFTGDLALLLHARDDVEKAIDSCRKALEINRLIGNKRSEGISLRILGDFYRQAKEFHIAEKYFGDALVLFKEINEKRAVAQTLSGLAHLLADMDRADEAEKLCLESLSIFEQLDDHPWLAVTSIIHAIILNSLKKLEEAEKTSRSSIAQCKKLNFKMQEAYAREILSEILFRRHADFEEISNELMMSEQIYQSLPAYDKMMEIRLKLIKMAFERKIPTKKYIEYGFQIADRYEIDPDLVSKLIKLKEKFLENH